MAAPIKARVRLTAENVKAARSDSAERHVWDSVVSGFALRLRPPSGSNPEGSKSFVFLYRFPGGREGKKQRITIGPADQWAVADARKQADAYASDVRQGRDPRAEAQARKTAALANAAGTFGKIAEQFLTRHSVHNRSHDETKRILDRYVLPKWRAKPIRDIRRLDVVELLDGVAENNGLVQADRVLATVRKLFHWFEARDDTFRSPVVKGMARTKPKERARKRVLSDDEIRAIWKAADETPGPYGKLVQFLFLTSTRREESSKGQWGEVEGSVFCVPASRVKAKQPHFVPLSRMALDVLASLPHFQIDGKSGPWLFSYDGRKAFNSHSEAKAGLDKRSGVTGWVLHDLRRTAKTLMSRAGIPGEHSERVLGHVIEGVEGIYDRYSYLREKTQALNALAGELQHILNPAPAKVLPLRAKRKGGK